MEEIEARTGAEGLGKTIGDVRGGAFIVALRRRDGTFQAQPSSETVLREGDVLVAMGTLRTMDRLEHLFDPAAAAAGKT
jgi:voltage-gated potassium channel